MRVTLEEDIEKQRVVEGLSQRGVGPYGKFTLLCPVFGRRLGIAAFDGRYEEGTPADHPAYGWEHVSISGQKFTPSWAEMCWVKDVFWLAEEPAFQMHPPKSEWVNNHPFCLHLWALIPGIVPVTSEVKIGNWPQDASLPKMTFRTLPRPPKSAV